MVLVSEVYQDFGSHDTPKTSITSDAPCFMIRILHGGTQNTRLIHHWRIKCVSDTQRCAPWYVFDTAMSQRRIWYAMSRLILCQLIHRRIIRIHDIRHEEADTVSTRIMHLVILFSGGTCVNGHGPMYHRCITVSMAYQPSPEVWLS